MALAWLDEARPEHWGCIEQRMAAPGAGDCGQLVMVGGEATLVTHKGKASAAKSTQEASLPGPGSTHSTLVKCILQLLEVSTPSVQPMCTRMAAKREERDAPAASNETSTGVHRLLTLMRGTQVGLPAGGQPPHSPAGGTQQASRSCAEAGEAAHVAASSVDGRCCMGRRRLP